MRVLLADDHEVVREGLASILKRRTTEFEVVAEVDNGRQAVEAWTTTKPDISIIDLRMPEMDGVTTIREIRKLDPHAKIVILTTYDTDEDIYQGLRAGAKGYLLKDADSHTILQAIHCVAQGQTYIPSTVAARLANRVQGTELSERETEILKLVANGLSNKEIGRNLDITEGTVKSYNNAIFEKLGVGSRSAAIRVAVERGLVKIEPRQ